MTNEERANLREERDWLYRTRRGTLSAMGIMFATALFLPGEPGHLPPTVWIAMEVAGLFCGLALYAQVCIDKVERRLKDDDAGSGR